MAPRFLQLDEFIKIFRMICKRGIWKTAYLNFLKDAHLQIPEEVQNKFWNWLNEGEQNPGLVPMKKFVDALEEMVSNDSAISKIGNMFR